MPAARRNSSRSVNDFGFGGANFDGIGKSVFGFGGLCSRLRQRLVLFSDLLGERRSDPRGPGEHLGSRDLVDALPKFLGNVQTYWFRIIHLLVMWRSYNGLNKNASVFRGIF